MHDIMKFSSSVASVV